MVNSFRNFHKKPFLRKNHKFLKTVFAQKYYSVLKNTFLCQSNFLVDQNLTIIVGSAPQVHVLPREIFGKSTFEFAVMMMKWLPVWLVDKILLILTWFIMGNIEKYGLKRPSIGPLELKNTQGKTPVLDIGALQKIRSRDIKVVPGIKRFSKGTVELVNGKNLEIDSVVLATGYCSNVPFWLQVRKNLTFLSLSLSLSKKFEHQGVKR